MTDQIGTHEISAGPSASGVSVSSTKDSPTGLQIPDVEPEISPVTACQWIGKDGITCGQAITVSDVPHHLASHGVHRMSAVAIVRCGWMNCDKLMTRQSITRHIRGVHMGHKRKA
ncbi:hypothetical protein J3R83DRAFT_11779 [Lanmaoa asiatica]|nr:hypothetical protein J3R83DRAFT_11779 [Lanmaoa asiatica]